MKGFEQKKKKKMEMTLGTHVIAFLHFPGLLRYGYKDISLNCLKLGIPHSLTNYSSYTNKFNT